MLQIRTRIDVADNTGARMAKMIGVIGKPTKVARVGDIITAHIREASPGGTTAIAAENPAACISESIAAPNSLAVFSSASTSTFD